MTVEWFIWSGMNAGLTRTEALHLPFSEVLDLIAIGLIKNGLAQQKPTPEEDADVFMSLLTYR